VPMPRASFTAIRLLIVKRENSGWVHLRQMLRLDGMTVTGHQFREGFRELVIWVRPYKNGCRCPVCERRCRIVSHGRDERQWTDIAHLGRSVVLRYSPKEIECPTHGRAQEIIPWAAPHARMTYRAEWRLCTLSQQMTQQASAQLLCMPKSTVSDNLHRVIQRTRAGHRIRGLASLGVDELSYKRGQKYLTLVYDLDRAKVLWVGEGKGRETIDRFFTEALTKEQRDRIRWASCDMANSYTEAIKEYCPNAKLVIDKFHLVKKLNEAVDEVRKEQWRQLEGEQKKTIKGLRWLLGKSSLSRTKGDTRALNALARGNRRIYRAWELKDEFEHFWSYTYEGSAAAFLKRWETRALRSRLPSVRKFVNTLRTYKDNILTYIERSLTNAVAEGINRKVKLAKHRASGYRGVEAFADMIYLIVGDLDIPAHVPSPLRSL
jgi:transposase